MAPHPYTLLRSRYKLVRKRVPFFRLLQLPSKIKSKSLQKPQQLKPSLTQKPKLATHQDLAMNAAAAAAAMSSSRRTFTAMATKEGGREITTLYRKLSALGGTNADARDTVDEWVSEGKSLTKYDIIGFVNQLRKYNQYNHAIQLLEWLDEKGLKLSLGDQAIRLDLLSKTEGIDSAEKYFSSFPDTSKSKHTYGALLNCYCKEQMKEKAMAVFEKMKELNLVSCLAYNNLMSLHMKLGEPEKVPELVKEMKQRYISPDVYTCNILINSHTSLNNISGAKSVLAGMKEKGIRPDWCLRATLASIFIKEHQFKKATSALRKIEKMKGLSDRKAYHTLINLYAQTRDKLAVYRVWKSLNAAFPKPTNNCYFIMLLALHKLDDTVALKNRFEEWESSFSTYDFRLTNILINSYLSRDMIEEAESLYEGSVKKGGKPNFKTLEMFMDFYLKKQEMGSALKFLEIAVSKVQENSKVGDKDWKPSQETISMFLKQSEKDVCGAEKLFKCLQKVKT